MELIRKQTENQIKKYNRTNPTECNKVKAHLQM